MKQSMKKFLCLLLALVLCFSGYQPSDIYAATAVVQQDESVAAAVKSLRQQLVDRKSEVSATFQSEGDPKDIMNSVIQQIFEPTGKAAEGDYLKWSMRYYSYGISYRTGTTEKTMTITPNYMTTKEQEDALSKKINQVLAELNLSGLSEYGKCVKIYDYITEHVTYDYANLENDAYFLKYSAYAALMNGTSVCQGYAMLFFRMATQAGLSVRMVTGLGNGGGHGWNIVQIGDSYYHLDATWDAGRPSSAYRYFLKGSTNFLTDHTLDAEFKTAEFSSRYPVSVLDCAFTPETDIVAGRGNCGSSVDWEVSRQKDALGTPVYTLTISGNGKMDSYTAFSNTPWADLASQIQTIVVEKDVKAIGNHAFDGCTNLRNVSLYPKMAKYQGDAIFPGTSTVSYACYANSTAESYLKHLQKTYTPVATSDSKIKATVTGFKGKYDGKEHQIQVTVSDLAADDYEIYYTTDEDLYGGSFSQMPIKLKDAGKTTVYYYICAEGYAIFKGSEVVEIEKADPGLKFTQNTITKKYGNAGFKNTLQASTDGRISYRSSNSTVATVDGAGNVTIKGAGTCSITASAAESKNYKAGEVSYQLTVEKENTSTTKPAVPAKISLSASSKKIAAGRKVTLTVTQKSKKLSAGKVTWSISNKKYATVSSSGVVTTKKAGAGKTVTVTAVLKSNKKVKASYKISIMKNAVTKVAIKNPPKTLKNGKSVTLKASVSANGSKANKTLKWSSSNTKYATVNSQGKVVAKKAGKGKSVRITAAATDGTGKKVTITIKIK